MKSNRTNRRDFITKSALAATGLSLGLNSLTASGSRFTGANDKIRMGFIGVGNRGSQLLRLFMTQPDCEVAALCDLYEPYLMRDYSKVDKRYTEGYLGKGGQIPKMGEKFNNNVTRYNDYRKLLEDKTIDAECIATPDHWHALQTIDALKHHSTSFAHLANIALATKTRLLWDAEKEQFTNSIEANKLLNYEYRKPWKL